MALITGAATLWAAILSAPAQAKWDYCYYGTPPEGVNEYTEMPPRSFGFGYAAVPYAFKKLCDLPFEEEAAHIRRIVDVYLECSAESELTQEIETGLSAPKERLIANYFDLPGMPAGPNWDAVCQAADAASVEWLAFADTWYFDGPTPGADRENLDALLAALNKFSEGLE